MENFIITNCFFFIVFFFIYCFLYYFVLLLFESLYTIKRSLTLPYCLIIYNDFYITSADLISFVPNVDPTYKDCCIHLTYVIGQYIHYFSRHYGLSVLPLLMLCEPRSSKSIPNDRFLRSFFMAKEFFRTFSRNTLYIFHIVRDV